MPIKSDMLAEFQILDIIMNLSGNPRNSHMAKGGFQDII